MSDRQIAKNRFHKGLSTHLRQFLRKIGVAVDEEAAQFALAGFETYVGHPQDLMVEAINDAFSQRLELMAKWEADNPKRNPYPPSFPERALKLVRDALRACYDEDGSPVYFMEKLKLMCEAELSTDPITLHTDDIEEN